MLRNAKSLLVTVSFLISVSSAFAVEPGDRVGNFKLLDTSGNPHELYYHSDATTVVLFTHSTEQQVDEINALSDAFPDTAFFAIASDAETPQHHGYQVPVLLDDHDLVRTLLGLEYHGEALVINPDRWRLTYRGSTSKLQYVLHAVFSQQPVTQGPLPLNRLSPTRVPAGISYSETVAPILINNCVPCHKPGGIGPWSMTSYEMVRGYSPMILEVMRTQRMPPWGADSRIGHFANDRSLTTDEVRTLNQWINSGSPRGEGEDPLLNVTPDKREWGYGEPELILELSPYEIPATGVLEYRYAKLKNPLNHEVWIRGSEILPGDASSLHHVLTRYRFMLSSVRNNFVASLFDRWPLWHFRNFIFNRIKPVGTGFGLYGPGNGPWLLPEDTGILLRPGAKLTLQMHYATYGKPSTDVSKLGFYLHKSPPKHELKEAVMINAGFRIPPGEKHYEGVADHVFKKDSLLFTLLPHAHYRGKSARFTAHFPNGEEEVLLSVPNFSFNWQLTYTLAEPRFIPKGTSVVFTMTWDNSKQNLSNPDPEALVLWGRQAEHEMQYGALTYRELDKDELSDYEPFVAKE